MRFNGWGFVGNTEFGNSKHGRLRNRYWCCVGLTINGWNAAVRGIPNRSDGFAGYDELERLRIYTSRVAKFEIGVSEALA